MTQVRQGVNVLPISIAGSLEVFQNVGSSFKLRMKNATPLIYRAGLSATGFELLGNSFLSLQTVDMSCVHRCSLA